MRFLAVVAMAFVLAMFAQPAAIGGADRIPAGDASNGKALFKSLRCDSCHSPWGSGTGAEHPLPDLSAQPPVAIAALIAERGRLAPEMLFDRMTMSFVVSNMTQEELGHIAMYLHDPSAARR